MIFRHNKRSPSAHPTGTVLPVAFFSEFLFVLLYDPPCRDPCDTARVPGWFASRAVRPRSPDHWPRNTRTADDAGGTIMPPDQ